MTGSAAMKHTHTACHILTLLCLLLCLPLRAAGAEPLAVFSQCSVVLDAENAQVLTGKGERERKFPASITKILTVALVLERHSLDERFSVNKEALFLPAGATQTALLEGEEVSVRDMSYAAMLYSANDAANALALFDSGSMEAFARRMNEKARALGAKESHFVNASGLHDPQHYTTARDMALITRWALSVPNFCEVFGALEYPMPATNRQPARMFRTQHMMYTQSPYAYSGAKYGKLGWTPESRHTMVTVAKRGDIELICVVLDSQSRGEKFLDTTALLDYCYENFRRVQLPLSGVLPERVPLGEGENAGRYVLFEIPSSLILDLPNGVLLQNLTLSHNIPALYRSEEEINPLFSLTQSNSGAPVLSLPLSYTLEEPRTDTPLLRLRRDMKALLAAAGEAWARFLALPGPVRVTLSTLFWLLLGYALWRAHEHKRRRQERKMLLEHLKRSLTS